MTEFQGKKRYPFRFSALMLVCFSAGILLSALCFGLTLWRFLDFLKEDIDSVYGWLQYLILFGVSLFFGVLIVSMLVRSQYVITEKFLITQFGIIRQKYEIKNVCSLHLYKGINKLAVYFDEYCSKYIVIVVKDVWYDDFIRTLLSIKPGIGFSFSTPEEEEEFKKKK